MQKIMMTSCFVFICLLLNYFTNALASDQDLFKLTPPKCFKTSKYCSTYELINDETGKYIKIIAWAKLEDFDNAQDIMNLYFDFKNWPKYIQGRGSVTFIDSIVAFAPTDPAIKVPCWHYAHYYNSAPFPLNSIEVKELTKYDVITPHPDWSDLSFSFITYDKDELSEDMKNLMVGIDPTYRMMGIQYKTGEVHIKKDQDSGVFNVVAVTRVNPTIDILPGIAAKYSVQSVVTIIKGLFKL